MATIASPGQQHQQRNNNNEETTNESMKSSSSTPLASTSPSATVVYDVEHLATFSTTGSHESNNGKTQNDDNDSNRKIKPESGLGRSNSTTTPRVALQRLFELEKLSGIWTQHMQIELRDDLMLIVDCETDSVVERFSRDCVTKPEAFNQYNDIYNNIVVFIIQQSKTNELSKHKREDSQNASDSDTNDTIPQEEGELHIFQCVSHKAQQLVSDILNWKSRPSVSSNDQNMVRSTDKESNSISTNGSSKKQDKKPAKDQDPTSSRQKSEQQTKKTLSNANGSGKPVVTVASSANASDNVPIVNVNVKETVQVFNQIAALREKSKPTSPINHNRPLSDASTASSHSTPAGSTAVTTNDPESSRVPLSPGGQLYKQRSIRATLAPKYTSADGTSPQATEQQQQQPVAAPPKMEAQPSSNNSASSASSSSVASSEAKAPPSYNSNIHNNQNAGRPAASEGRRDSDIRQASTNGNHNSSRSSSNQHQLPNQAQQHKSSKLHSRVQQQQQQRSQSDSSRSQVSSTTQSQLDQVSTNESYVSVLNHCFDDIEKFIIRLQQAVASQATLRELQTKRKMSKRASQANRDPGQSDSLFTKTGAVSSAPITASELAMLNARARGPSEDDYFEILSKFKLAFNLLAKLRGCIHEPNAPELVHFLFTPLDIIIESARNATPPIDPTLVGIPYLNQDALDLLSNCCTSKESDMWISLGPNWTQTIDMNLLKASRLPSSFQPIFSDGWAPIIGELELIGLVAPTSLSSVLSNDCTASTEVIDTQDHHHHRHDSHRLPPYLLDEASGNLSSVVNGIPIDHSIQSAGTSNGRLDGSKPHLGSSREYKKKTAPAPPHIRHHDTLEPQPYLNQMNSMPYNYIHDPNNDIPVREMQESYRALDHSTRNHRFSGNDNLAIRRPKQGSRHTDYPHSAKYDPSTHYPPMSLQQSTDDENRLDVDLIAHQNGMLHSNDYTELQGHYLDDHHLKAAPGSSSHHYRGDKNQNITKQQHKAGHRSSHKMYNQHPVIPPFETDYLNEAEHQAMLIDLGPVQTEWFYELQSRGAMIVRVLFTRDANNEKELSVRRGEILEVLDDTRKWWRTRNIDLQVAHVPHTIVAVMHGYQTLDELLANSPVDMATEDPSMLTAQRFPRREMIPENYSQSQWHGRGDKRNSKTAGAFRYF